jgi:glycosyltransferase A (GT-A) superfamily protein (DUF2064 family)
VFRQTLERCRDLGLEVHRLPPSYDVDEAADVDRLRSDVLASPERAPRVAAFFRAQ